MKKFFLLTLLVAIATSVAAQQQVQPRNAVVYHHEFSASAGLASTQDFVLTAAPTVTAILTMAGYNEDNFRYGGNYTLAYKYRFGKVASLGATYSIGNLSSDIYALDMLWGKQRSVFHTLAVECDLRYLTRKAVTLYSTIGVGATIYARSAVENGGETEKISVALPNAQLTLIGAKIGSHRAGGLVELGFGYKGIVNVGGYVRF
ncbi:MAG: hypothetical protein LBM63_05390 [Rikenellaceae bacterium]|jgi:hypothetical protein|nr:hypothetical protein [Rikenellaceae bacterium]